MASFHSISDIHHHSDHACDYNDNQQFNVGNVGALAAALRASDANLDGQFDTCDLVDVLATGKYEGTISSNAGWSSRDWNGDSDFTSSDLVVGLGRRRF